MTHLPALLPWDLPPPDAAVEDAAYHAALQRIFGFSEAPRTPVEIERGRVQKLVRVRSLLGLIGSPQSRFASVLVAGTKGKGSMAAMLTQVLTEAGFRVGRYTQPHLYSYRERVWADGEFISAEGLVELMVHLESALWTIERARSELGPLTTFDVGTVLALQHFADRNVDVAVVEVGVGGAHDATNVLEPVIALLGPVGLDHTATLGPTLSHIGREKAGVGRRGRPLVVGQLHPEAMAAVREVTEETGAHLVHACPARWSDTEETFEVDGPGGPISGLRCGLEGAFQRQNASVVAVAAQLLASDGWAIHPEHIRRGIRNVRWPGRLQTIVPDPLTIVDGAHNPAAFAALADTLRTQSGVHPCTVVLGMTLEKDSRESLRALAPSVDRVIVTRSRHPRAMPVAMLAEAAREAGLQPEIMERPEDAVIAAWGERAALTLITGSLFLVGDVLEWLWREASSTSYDLSAREREALAVSTSGFRATRSGAVR